MKEIKDVALIGAGSLGVMYGQKLTEEMGRDHVCFVADQGRLARYQKEGIFCNERPCEFRWLPAGADTEKADLIIFSVKYTGLKDAMEAVAGMVKPDTLMISLVNGIISEEEMTARFGAEHVLYCIAQEMDSTRTGNRVEYHRMGWLVFGDREDRRTEQVERLEKFFREKGIPYRIPENIRFAQWDKLMFNVGVNQATAVYGTDYGGVQQDGEARETMLAAMREAAAVGNAQGMPLTEEHIDRWMERLDKLTPSGMTSMRQDTRDGKKTEVELFAGTICALGRKHGIDTPVNDWLYQRIRELEG